MKRGLYVIAILVVLLPLGVTSTPPSLGPWHHFDVSGYLDSASDGPVANYTVAAMEYVNGAWSMVHSCPVAIADYYGGTNDIYLTNHFGRFYLSIWCCTPPESIAAAVVLPDTILMGAAIERRSLYPQEYNGTYEVTEDGFLCDHTDKRNYVQGYFYNYVDSVLVPVP